MKERQPALAPVLRQIVRALRANNDCPENHARALEAYLQVARRSVPARGIFEPGSREEIAFFEQIHAIANKHLGRSSARAKFTKAVEASGLPFKEQDAILTSAGDFYDVSDTAYFYAGLAFALAFVWYGAAFTAAPAPTSRAAKRR